MIATKLVTIKQTECDGVTIMHLLASSAEGSEHEFKQLSPALTWGENAKPMLTEWAIKSGYVVTEIIGHYPLIAITKQQDSKKQTS